ncbi:C45 family autoproteolytic acyltransferase/hydolase [Bacillus sp. NPDC077027]|uniref:C45 family autoproteolytic acyltransferase/hydolase n=1 Tax=Bacillus sp. NPDC077027 TaxID=3390548 RepID=UPI003D052C8A
MQEMKGYFQKVAGTAYEVGRQQAEWLEQHPDLKGQYIHHEVLDEHALSQTKQLLRKYSPQLEEEIAGFCDYLQIEEKYLSFYHSSYLQPGCSHCVVLPPKTVENQLIMMRNYDFSPVFDDMRLVSAHVEDQAVHTGSSILLFGRTDGMNEHGLSVTFSACGAPVGNEPGLKPPQVAGLQIYHVIRFVLDQCKTVQEAITYVHEMPVASNVHLMFADRKGHTAAIEIVNGEQVVRRPTADYIAATNHPLADVQKQGFTKYNSVRRYELITDTMKDDKIPLQALQALFATEYPAGLTVHNYEEMFGTMRTLMFRPADLRIDYCFGSPLYNETYTLQVGETLSFQEKNIQFQQKDYGSSFWRSI